MDTSKTEIGISEQILNFINAKTHRETLEEQSTKQVAAEFNLTTSIAYRICDELAKKRLITKLDPVNGNKFDCCGWIRNTDPSDEQILAAFELAKSICPSCEGTGQIHHNGSTYGCAHGLSYQQRKLSTGQVL